ncbi:MAG: type VI secretion system tip protein TssI/VgrG, partial [Acidobacteriota bacterium]
MGTGTFTQQNRLLSLTTPLGPDKLLLRSFTGHEAISQIFHFQLDLLSTEPAINFDDIVGKNITFGIVLADNTNQRLFNGCVSRFAQLGGEGRLARYQAEVAPQLWFLTRTADCRIYQNQSVPDIIQEVLQRFGVQHVENQLQGSYRTWDYCVQYRETAYHFIQRLMEQEGIFYFFKHEEGKHTLVLADASSVHRPCPNQETVRYEPGAGPGFARDEDYVYDWRLQHEIRPGRYATADFNFETPMTKLLSSVDSSINQGGNSAYEVYDYPGEYAKRDEGDREARLRMEEEETPHAVITGAGYCRAFTPGYKFDFTEHERRDQNATYLLTSVNHTAHEGGFYSGIGSPQDAAYENMFTCIPYEVPFRPPQVTTKPLCRGSQTAIVTGPSGEEIYTDKYGRVKVQFHWDRLGEYNEKSSCWVRVSQPWAGKNWGAIWIPRIGQEVVVDFLEGDPDRPLITGRVYNAVQMPPYGLPGEQTKSTFKSYSSKGGGGFNEIRFEDKKGSEQVFIHGEKDLDIRVKNDRREWIGRDRHLIVKRDKVEQIERDEHAVIQRDRIEKIERDHYLTIEGKEAIKIDGSHSFKVDGNVIEQFGANHSEQVTANYYLKGMNIVIEADVGLTIKVGGNFVTINPAGVQISGTMLMLNSGGSALSGSPGNLVSPQAPKKAEIADNADPGSEAP